MAIAVSRAPHALLAYAFRPFFLLAGAYGAFAIAGWAGFLLAGWPVPVGQSPVLWHSHELLFGLVPAAIAGFLLTAISNWTGARPLQGPGLLALVVLWLAGRLVMWLSGLLPQGLVAAVDLAFLPALAGYVATVLIRHGNWRNLIMVGVLLALAVANLLVHLSLAGFDGFWGRGGELLALNLVTLLMVVVAGRIIPAFTANWLRGQGRPTDGVRVVPGLERAVIPATALMIPADLITGIPLLGAAAALVAAGVNGWRLTLWSGWCTSREPLLWVLHVAYLWIVVALLTKSLAPLTAVPATAWIHALGAGAIGTLILGVMTRVAVGHTGRPLRLMPFALVLYVAVTLAALIRVLVAFGQLDFQAGLVLAALGWTLAFGGFSVIYWPVLSRPRVDGRPG
jgi:uncharacterized protein involved in response to NO